MPAMKEIDAHSILMTLSEWKLLETYLTWRFGLYNVDWVYLPY